MITNIRVRDNVLSESTSMGIFAAMNYAADTIASPKVGNGRSKFLNSARKVAADNLARREGKGGMLI